MRARAVVALAALTLYAAAVSPVAAQDLPVVRAAVDTTVTTVGGRLQVTLDIETPDGWFVTPPEKVSELGTFRVRSFEEVERSAGHRRLVLTLVATEAGEVEIPPITLKATQGDDPDGVEFTTEPIPILVASNLASENATAPEGTIPGHAGSPGKADAPPATVDGPPGPGTTPGAGAADGPKPADLKPALNAQRRWLPVIVAAAALVLGLVAGLFALRWWRARELAAAQVPDAPRVSLRPAWEVATEELDAIVAAGWVEQGQAERQYEEVTETLRRYLENRYGVHALECTTEELQDLMLSAPIRTDLSKRILSLLREADLIKFAKGIPDPAEARRSEQRVREIVHETTPVRETREEAA